jgi:3-hydroxyisobutyrate dehydrogenase
MDEEFKPPERIGLIGIGQMGYPMARNLAKAGFRLAIADTNRQAVERFAAEVPCEVPADLAALGKACRVVITMLPDGNSVRQVIVGRGPEGAAGAARSDDRNCVAAGLARGSVVMDMSSSSPLGTRALGEELARRGIALVDAPVSGGVKRALDGSLAVMMGGAPDAVQRCRRLALAMGRHIFTTGPLGSGHAMKALNNYVSAAGFAAAAEAVLAANRFGLDPAVVVGVLNASSGRNNSTENKFDQFIFPRTFNSGFTIGLMVKDLRIAADVVRASGTPPLMAEPCLDIWARAEQAVGGKADHTAVVQFWESLAGSEIGEPPGDRKEPPGERR